MKFTERGAIEISLQATPGENQDICLEFAIRDTGIGIPAAALTRLFTRFVQSDASVARRFGGTGLGLSICKSLVELMDGRIWAVSEPGKGSTFFFTVQLARAAALPCETEGAVMVASPVAKLHVLLVEDNPANQKLATYILQDRGHEITIAGDGYEAIRLTEQHTFDVILMDVQMPGMNGLEATAAIRKREGGATRVPIIAMTAFAMEKDRERCLDAGMDGYLSKPISAAEMLAMVEKAAGGPAGEPATSDQICPPIAAAAKETSTIVFDPALALELCSGSQDAVQVFIENFFREQDTLLPEIDRALQKDDIAHIERLLHRLKGTLVYLGTPGVLAAVVHAEELCKDTASAHPKIAETIQKVQENCQRLGAVLTGYSSTSAFN